MLKQAEAWDNMLYSTQSEQAPYQLFYLVITRDWQISGRVSHTGQNIVANESGQKISFC